MIWENPSYLGRSLVRNIQLRITEESAVQLLDLGLGVLAAHCNEYAFESASAHFHCQDIFANQYIGKRVSLLFYLNSANVTEEVHITTTTRYRHREVADRLY